MGIGKVKEPSLQELVQNVRYFNDEVTECIGIITPRLQRWFYARPRDYAEKTAFIMADRIHKALLAAIPVAKGEKDE